MGHYSCRMWCALSVDESSFHWNWELFDGIWLELGDHFALLFYKVTGGGQIEPKNDDSSSNQFLIRSVSDCFNVLAHQWLEDHFRIHYSSQLFVVVTNQRLDLRDTWIFIGKRKICPSSFIEQNFFNKLRLNHKRIGHPSSILIMPTEQVKQKSNIFGPVQVQITDKLNNRMRIDWLYHWVYLRRHDIESGQAGNQRLPGSDVCWCGGDRGGGVCELDCCQSGKEMVLQGFVWTGECVYDCFGDTFVGGKAWE